MCLVIISIKLLKGNVYIISYPVNNPKYQEITVNQPDVNRKKAMKGYRIGKLAFLFKYVYDMFSVVQEYETPAEGEEVNTELDKYWKAVRDNPGDFTGWTYLLQYVEQEVRDSITTLNYCSLKSVKKTKIIHVQLHGYL